MYTDEYFAHLVDLMTPMYVTQSMFTGLCRSGGLILYMNPQSNSLDPNITPTEADLNTSLVTINNLGSLATNVTIYSLHSNFSQSEKMLLYQGCRNGYTKMDTLGLVDLAGTWRKLGLVDLAGTWRKLGLVDLAGTCRKLGLVDLANMCRKLGLVDLAGMCRELGLVDLAGTYRKLGLVDLAGTYRKL